MSKAVFYNRLPSPSAKVYQLILELGLTDQIDVKNVTFQDIKKPEFLAINPAGTNPTFVTESNEVLIESSAIALHILEKYVSKDHPLLGRPEQRAQFLDLVLFSPASMFPTVHEGFTETFKPEAERNQSHLASAESRFKTQYTPHLEKILGDKDYLLGDTFTLPDLLIGCELSGANKIGWLSDKLKSYLARLAARKSYQETYTFFN